MSQRALDESFVRRCLALAAEALASGETPVGAVVVRDGRVIGEAGERTRARHDPSAHAEVEAIRAACREERSTDLTGCTLYTTVEPCVLCAYVIRRCGVSRVVYGAPAGEAGGVTSRYAILMDGALRGWPPPPEVVAGVMEGECRELLQRRAGRAGGAID
ncbi:MAG TPA: nucleoside deaminase [Gemmatimonadaceae bacterium]